MQNAVAFGSERDCGDFRGDLRARLVSGRHSGLFPDHFQAQRDIVRGYGKAQNISAAEIQAGKLASDKKNGALP